ncbi:MAG TPA: flagellin lysine-N-methylase [Polyangiaceae bacterium]
MPILTAKYVERFQCIGPACEDTCCHGWSVQLTREDKKRLDVALDKAPEALRERKTAIVADPHADKSSPRPFVMQTTAEGYCQFLSPERLCQIHSTLGEQLLPGVCAQYPREVARFGGTREMWAALSCPEAVRLCLLSESGAELCELEEVPGLRHEQANLVIHDQTPDYQAYLDEIRRYVVELLSLRDFSVRARLFFIAYFAHRVGSYFDASTTTVDRKRLSHDMQALRDPNLLGQLAAELDSVSVPGTYAISLVASVTKSRTGLSAYPEPAWAHSEAFISPPLEAHETLSTAAWLDSWIDYSTRRLRWENEFSGLLEQAFENYCKLFWMKEWYIQSSSLLAHANACLLRVAIVRHRLFTHPDLDSSTAGMSHDEKRQLLERKLVAVVTSVARAVEHDRPFLRVLNDALARHGMQDLAHTALLLLL